MRSKLLALVIGCGLVTALALPGLACSFNTQASSDSQPQQQTAQAQTTTSATSAQ